MGPRREVSEGKLSGDIVAGAAARRADVESQGLLPTGWVVIARPAVRRRRRCARPQCVETQTMGAPTQKS
jgi:hypothetical protein